MLEAMQALSAAVQAAAGITIRYRRGPLVESIYATLGKTEYEQDTGFGIRRIVGVDFLTDAAAFIAAFGEPQAGDAIELSRADGAKTAHYVVASPPDGGPPWRYCDTYQVRLRIHAKERETRSA